jgi:predicted homoserine dehydrogenase-like protein
MIIVDTAIRKRIAEGNPVRVGMIGAGYSARHIASQILSSFPGMYLAAIANRTPAHAQAVYRNAGASAVRTVKTPGELQDSMAGGGFAITDDSRVLFDAPGIEAIIETTGEVEFGAWAALQSIQAGKHTVVLNCEMDATVGPILKVHADRQGVIYSNTDGDEPGVARNLSRHVRTLGLEVVGAGNLKGFYDPHRTPATQEEFARKNDQKPHMMTSFVDGTKLSMELAVLGNSLGFGVGKRGMYGPACEDVRTCLPKFPEGVFRPGRGIVDYLLGASPYTGAFVIGHTDQPMKQEYLRYLKMGEGPCYVFYTPFHLPQLEIPITVARAVLLHDATVAPGGRPSCDAIAVSKRELKAGEKLDGIGGYTCYALIDNYDTCRKENLLPMGVSEGCVVKQAIPADRPITYADVELPKGRLVDRLRDEMQQGFGEGRQRAQA